MKDKKDVVPIIVNGELNNGKKKEIVRKEEKLPQKTFKFSDIVLTFIGICLIIYGVYGLLTKKDNKDIETLDSNLTEEKEQEQNSFKIEDYLIFNTIESSNIYDKNDYANMATGLNASKLSNNSILSMGAKAINKNIDKSYITEKEMDAAIYNIFGKINVPRQAFNYGKYIYTYNQETKRYYLMSKNKSVNLNYKKYNYIDKKEENNQLTIKEYVVYTTLNNDKSWTLNNAMLTEVINDTNIKEKYNSLKYFEYQFVKQNDRYILNKITIK